MNIYINYTNKFTSSLTFNWKIYNVPHQKWHKNVHSIVVSKSQNCNQPKCSSKVKEIDGVIAVQVNTKEQ